MAIVLMWFCIIFAAFLICVVIIRRIRNADRHRTQELLDKAWENATRSSYDR